jgi:hypothetical protein
MFLCVHAHVRACVHATREMAILTSHGLTFRFPTAVTKKSPPLPLPVPPKHTHAHQHTHDTVFLHGRAHTQHVSAPALCFGIRTTARARDVVD